MGKVLTEISEREVAFISSQKVFFVATAPLSSLHHVSVSPKAQGCIVLDPYTVAYADLTGSGAETAAHVLENGRMTILFCNLEKGLPKILRLFGKAELILAENVPASLRNKFPAAITDSFGFRAVYRLQVTRISTSCGYSLPVMEFQHYRNTLNEFAEKKGEQGMFDYVTEKNSFSIDGLPSLALLRKSAPPVEPVAEDGYIFGKQVKGTMSSGPAITAQKLHLQAYTGPRKLTMQARELFVIGLVAFVAGILAGMWVSHQEI